MDVAFREDGCRIRTGMQSIIGPSCDASRTIRGGRTNPESGVANKHLVLARDKDCLCWQLGLGQCPNHG